MNKGLTSFRALAFFAIFLFHINVLGSGQLGIEGGYLGIQAFFVLSGFLLTPILVDMKSTLNKKDFFIHFYGRRALRIFPLYYSYIVIVASVSFWAISQHGHSELIAMERLGIVAELGRFIEQLPWTMTYTADFYHVSLYSKDSIFATHFWSLAVEEQFYLVWPLAIFFIPSNYLKRFLLLVIVVGPLMRVLLATIFDANMLPLIPQKENVIYVLPFSHIDAFAIGGYFSLYRKSKTSYLVWVSIFFVLMIGIITSWLSTGQIHWGQLGYKPYMEGSYKYVWGYSIVNLMFAYVLVHIESKTLMPALFENPLLVYLGTISYGLYVFHLPVLWLVYSTVNSYSEIFLASTSLLITVMISMVSYEFMEKRFINLKDKLFAKASADK
jgi:peptidoglycan/LPS O-acetylase OafA/YrhL